MQNKPVFGVFDKARLKPVSLITESLDMILSNELKANALFRLCGCAGWSAPLLFTCPEDKYIITLTVFLIFFFYINFLETKAPIRPAVHRLVWIFVVPMYQRRISRDKVHTIFKNSKLNVKIYTRNTPDVYAEGCIVFVFPFVRSSFPISVSRS